MAYSTLRTLRPPPAARFVCLCVCSASSKVPRADFGCALVGAYVVAIGGVSGVSSQSTQHNLAGAGSSAAAQQGGPAGAAGAPAGEAVHVCEAKALSRCEALDLRSMRWRVLPDLPGVARWGCRATSLHLPATGIAI